MAIVAETHASQRLDGKTGERGYIVTEAASAGDARTAVLGAAPTSWEGKTRNDGSVRVEETEAADTWTARVPYRSSSSSGGGQPVNPGDSAFSFEIATQRQRITQSISTREKKPTDAPDFGKAINVNIDTNGNIDVRGAEIEVPTFSWAETHVFDDASVTDTYKQTLFDIAGKINNGTFKGFAAGTTLFNGASGNQGGDGDWTIKFSFESLPNESNLAVGNGITIGSKFGWDFLWTLYEDEDDGGELVRKPKAAYVEQVYRDANFAGLNIGT